MYEHKQLAMCLYWNGASNVTQERMMTSSLLRCNNNDVITL